MGAGEEEGAAGEAPRAHVCRHLTDAQGVEGARRSVLFTAVFASTADMVVLGRILYLCGAKRVPQPRMAVQKSNLRGSQVQVVIPETFPTRFAPHGNDYFT